MHAGTLCLCPSLESMRIQLESNEKKGRKPCRPHLGRHRPIPGLSQNISVHACRDPIGRRMLLRTADLMVLHDALAAAQRTAHQNTTDCNTTENNQGEGKDKKNKEKHRSRKEEKKASRNRHVTALTAHCYLVVRRRFQNGFSRPRRGSFAPGPRPLPMPAAPPAPSPRSPALRKSASSRSCSSRGSMSS